MNPAKKKAAPVDQTEGGEGCQQMAFAGVFGYDSDFITGRTDPQLISDFLMHGSVNAVPLRELERMTGLDGRVIRRKIQQERKDGSCICVNNMDGYFWPRQRQNVKCAFGLCDIEGLRSSERHRLSRQRRLGSD